MPPRLLSLRRFASAAAGLARRHWPFLALLAAGAVLRALAMVAYRPALLGASDVNFYLAGSEELFPSRRRPLGYAVFLRVLPLENELAVVPFVQHLIGLGIAALLYVLLIRLGVGRVPATLGAAPVLLDLYQVNLEHWVLSDTLFELLVAGAAVALLWRRPPGLVAAAGAGVLLAAAALTRSAGTLLVVPVALAAFFAWEHRRLARVAVLALAFALPVAGYATWFHSFHNRFAITSYGERYLYARVAPFVDCSRFYVPPREWTLCPTQPIGQRPGSQHFMWSKRSPAFRLPHPRRPVLGSFARRVIWHQPLDYIKTVAPDLVRGFAWERSQRPREPPIARWRFPRRYVPYRRNTDRILRAHGDVRGQVDPELASVLIALQRYVYVPGPVLAACLVLALAAVLGLGRARQSGLRAAAFVFALLAVALVVTSVATAAFSWRYWFPTLALLPPAGALGWTAVTGRRAGTGPPG